MHQLSYYVLRKTLKYLDSWIHLEKLENLNNELNSRIIELYENTRLNFKDNGWHINLRKLTKKYLVRSLSLPYNIDLADGDLELLQEIHTLNLWNHQNITDKGLYWLRGIHTLILPHNNMITDKGLKIIRGVHYLYLHDNELITTKWLNGTCLNCLNLHYHTEIVIN